ncbi:MAG: hypothetical protein ABSD57_14925 [Verrucomicrobiota bacterium]
MNRPNCARQWGLALAFGLMLAPFAVRGQQSIYVNNGTISGIPPQVNATNFYNSGSWDIFTSPYPYQTANTLNYTNVGSMTGSVGWEFDHGPLPNGGRGMSANFVNNSASAMIQAEDLCVANPVTLYRYPVSFLWISATNIVNKGTLIASANGEIKLTGGNVSLSRSQLEIMPITSFFCYGQPPGINGTNFTSDIAVYSTAWGQTNGLNIDSSALWNGTSVTVPAYTVHDPNFQNGCSTNLDTGPLAGEIIIPNLIGSTNMVVSTQNVTYTNNDGSTTTTVLATNVINQAVFVRINTNSGITAQIRFSGVSTNSPQIIAVQLGAPFTNVITLAVQTNYIYLVDLLAAATNNSLVTDTNFNPSYYCTAPKYRPANYLVSRSDPVLLQTGLSAFGSGVPGAGTAAPNFFYQPTFTNNVVAVSAAAYSAFIDNLAAELSEAAITNLPGRIGVYANNLDLTRMRATALSEITIRAGNVVNIANGNAVLDCQNLSLDLGSTNGYLNITNFVNQYVSRFQGNISAFSAVWTNQMDVQFNNYTRSNAVNPLGQTNVVYLYTPFTNFVQERFSILILDATNLSAQIPVIIQDLRLHSTNSAATNSPGSIVISDPATSHLPRLFRGESHRRDGVCRLAHSGLGLYHGAKPSLFHQLRVSLHCELRTFRGRHGRALFGIYQQRSIHQYAGNNCFGRSNNSLPRPSDYQRDQLYVLWRFLRHGPVH